MPARRLLPLVPLATLTALAHLAACASPPHIPRLSASASAVASCPAADRLLSEAARASDGGQLFRALARAEAADRACASDATRDALARARADLWSQPATPPAASEAASDAEAVLSASYLRLAGDPSAAIAKLAPIAPRLDEAGLLELARTAAAAGHDAEARRAFERAAARAEKRSGQRGRWHWQDSSASPITRLAFTPDGAKLVTADRADQIRVWDIAGGHALATLENARAASGLAISPNGRWVAATAGGRMQVWSLASSKQVLDLPFSAPAVFTPDGTLVASTRGTMVELAIPSGKELSRFGTQWPDGLAAADRIYEVHGNDAHQQLLTTWDRGLVRRKLDEVVLPQISSVAWLQRSSRGDLAISADNKVLITDEHGVIRHTLRAYAAFAFTADGAQAVASPASGGIDILDVASGKLLRHIDLDPLAPGAAPGAVADTALAVHPRGGLIAASERGGLSLRRLDTGAPVARLGVPTGGRAIAFDAAGGRLAIRTDAGPATIWSLADGTAAAVRAPQDVSGFAWSSSGADTRDSDEGLVVTVAGDPSIDLTLGEKIEIVAADRGRHLLATAGDGDGRIALWDLTTRRPVRVLLEDAAVSALAWSPGAPVLASASARTARLWDPYVGARLAALEAHAPIASLAFRPDGRVLAVACTDGLVELWAVATGTLVATLAAPGGGRGLAIAPDGAVDGAPADGDPLFWTAGGATLPARAVWERQAEPGLLAARLAAVPAEPSPQPDLSGAAAAPDPPACFSHDPDSGARAHLVSSEVSGDNSISLCVEHARWRREHPELPACFDVDLATGIYRPRPPAPEEVVSVHSAGSRTTKIDGKQVTVCKDGACREVTVPELAGASGEGHVEINAAASLLVAHVGGSAAVYDVAKGRRLSRIDLGSLFGDDERYGGELDFIGDTLVVTTTPCAGPCSTSVLVDPRTGKSLGWIGGSQPLNTSWLTSAHLGGDVYAFGDNDSATIVYQDIRTGRVLTQFEHQSAPCDEYPCTRVDLLATGGRLAAISGGRAAGDLTLYDASGAVLVRYELPRCQHEIEHEPEESEEEDGSGSP